MHIIESPFGFGDIVYLKTDSDQKPRMVTGFLLTVVGCRIELSCGTSTSYHYPVEVTADKDVLLTTTN